MQPAILDRTREFFKTQGQATESGVYVPGNPSRIRLGVEEAGSYPLMRTAPRNRWRMNAADRRWDTANSLSAPAIVSLIKNSPAVRESATESGDFLRGPSREWSMPTFRNFDGYQINKPR